MRIKKTSQYIEGGASLSNVYGTSQSNGYTQEYINGLNTYSTSEQRIGTWIDGKPLYRKVISTTLTTGAPIANISNINIRSISGIVKRGTQEWNINTIYPNDSTICCSTFYDENSGDLFAVYGTSFTSGSEINVILEYTKTTDTAQNTRSISNDEEIVEEDNR